MRTLSLGDEGPDVIVAQRFLARVNPISFDWGRFDTQTKRALKSFQQQHMRMEKPSGILDQTTASSMLAWNRTACDGYVDEGRPASERGLKYKISIRVDRNRSVEDTNAVLMDENNTVLHRFTARAHGHDSDAARPWPDFDSNDPGLNQYSHDGNTVTGLALVDLNSPEPDPGLYGPYPINRLVSGLAGNAKWLLPDIRNGILVHTGNWSAYAKQRGFMPNSAGCVHVHADDVKIIWKTLVSLGVEVRPNPGGIVPYPYEPQGLISIEQLDRTDGCL